MKYLKVIERTYKETTEKRAKEKLEQELGHRDKNCRILKIDSRRSKGLLKSIFKRDVRLIVEVTDDERTKLGHSLNKLKEARELLSAYENDEPLTEQEIQIATAYKKGLEERFQTFSTEKNAFGSGPRKTSREKINKQESKIDNENEQENKDALKELKKELKQAKKEKEAALEQAKKEKEKALAQVKKEREKALFEMEERIKKEKKQEQLKLIRKKDREFKTKEGNLGRVFEYLEKQGVAGVSLDKMQQKMTSSNNDSIEVIQKEINEILSDYIKSNEEGFKIGHRTMYFGATGVGKTSTIVKLMHKEGKSGSFVLSGDNVRIGSETELEAYKKTYDLFGKKIDLENIHQEIEHLPYENLHIDLPGTNPKNLARLKRVHERTKNLTDIEKTLIVCATQKNRDLIHTIKCYDELGIDHIIVTKMDETNEPGTIVNIAMESGKPIRYITNGQNVTAFIQPFRVEEYLNYLWLEFAHKKEERLII